MSWQPYRRVWRVESPLFVGMPPARALNRCRLYVPAWVVWGAMTAELARENAPASFPAYPGTGARLQGSARFTYLYPACLCGDTWVAWLPAYREEEGLA